MVALEPPELACEIIFLGGNAFIYSDQNWDEFPGIAVDAYNETKSRLFLYWAHLCSGAPIFENGALIKTRAVFYRCLELANGISRLSAITMEPALLN